MCTFLRYKEDQKAALTGGDSGKKFHALVKNYKSVEREVPYDLKELYPGQSSGETAEELADFFDKISREFQPLEPCDVQQTYRRELPVLEAFQVSGRLKSFSKPRSVVSTDVFPALITKFHDLFAIPLTSIYNEGVFHRVLSWELCYST